jgi:hypothetical protein
LLQITVGGAVGERRRGVGGAISSTTDAAAQEGGREKEQDDVVVALDGHDFLYNALGKTAVGWSGPKVATLFNRNALSK